MTWNRRHWQPRWSTYRRTTRAQRRASREYADDTMVRIWLDANPRAPLGTAGLMLPLSGRRLRRSFDRLLAEVGSRPRPKDMEMVRAAVDGRRAACPEHGIQIIDDGRPRCGCPMEEMAHD